MWNHLFQDPVSKLSVIQRGLVLFKHHLDAFRQRYAYHLHMWQLDNVGISSHLPANKQQTINIFLQNTDMSDKVSLFFVCLGLAFFLLVLRFVECVHYFKP